MLKLKLTLAIAAILAVPSLPCLAQYADNPYAQGTPPMGTYDPNAAVPQLRGTDPANQVIPNTNPSPYQVSPYPNAAGAPPMVKQKKQRHHSVVGDTVAMPSTATKGTLGAADKTAKVGAGMTDRAVKTTVGLPFKGAKEIFKMIF
jgi:hypothetical protein